MKKTEVLKVRMTAAQHAAIRELAGQQDWTVSQWVRAVLLATAQANWNPKESLLMAVTDRPVDRVATPAPTRSSVLAGKGRATKRT